MLPTAQPLLQMPTNVTAPVIPTAATNSTTTSWQDLIMSRETCVYVFTILTVTTVLITLVRSYMFFFMCMRASRRLHDKMFDSITRATMYFFNTNSSGTLNHLKLISNLFVMLICFYVFCYEKDINYHGKDTTKAWPSSIENNSLVYK